MIEDQIKLLAFQQTLEVESPGKSFIGLSINETIRSCLIAGLSKKADKVRSDFKVPDKRSVPPLVPARLRSLLRSFWYVKMKALVEVRDWEGLETFANSKKSPIGYEPWVEHLIASGSHRQAVAFIPRCELRNRVELYVKCGEWVMAGQESVRRADKGRLK